MISVLIPTYNSVDSLDLLIRSLVEGADDISQVEIIVGIDGTEDCLLYTSDAADE